MNEGTGINDLYEEVASCALCGSARFSELFTVTDLLAGELLRKSLKPEEKFFLAKIRNRLVRCDACRLAFLSPRLHSEALNRLYELWYRYGYTEIFTDDDHIQARRREFENYHYKTMSNYVLKPGSLLDIGCGSGLFMNVCEERGWDVDGIESSREAADYAVSHFCLNVRHGDLLSFESDRKYDVVVMNDFLEHTRNPLDCLRHANTLTKSGGIIMIRVPNIESIQSRLMRHRWYGILALHLFYFSRATIKTALVRCGFEPIEVRARNYATYRATAARNAIYVLRKIKKWGLRHPRSAFDGTSAIHDGGAERPRIGTYALGQIMEWIDLGAGFMNRSNYLTVVARKVSCR